MLGLNRVYPGTIPYAAGGLATDGQERAAPGKEGCHRGLRGQFQSARSHPSDTGGGPSNHLRVRGEAGPLIPLSTAYLPPPMPLRQGASPLTPRPGSQQTQWTYSHTAARPRRNHNEGGVRWATSDIMR